MLGAQRVPNKGHSFNSAGNLAGGVCSSLLIPEFLQVSFPLQGKFFIKYKSRSQASRELPAEDKSGLKKEGELEQG